MALLDTLLPTDTELGVHPDRLGPIRAAEFESWPQDPDNPMELVAGWVVPMSPGTFYTGERSGMLFSVLLPRIQELGWKMSQDARHRLPHPANTTVYPDLAIHCTGEIAFVPGTETVSRVPDVVIELLSEATAERDRAPRGAKFLAYQMSGVSEYYYAWPDGRESAGFRLVNGVFVPVESDAEGFFASPLLGRRLRLVPAALAT